MCGGRQQNIEQGHGDATLALRTYQAQMATSLFQDGFNGLTKNRDQLIMLRPIKRMVVRITSMTGNNGRWVSTGEKKQIGKKSSTCARVSPEWICVHEPMMNQGRKFKRVTRRIAVFFDGLE